jgi:hypothetical protein
LVGGEIGSSLTLSFGLAPTSADRDAAFTVERFKLVTPIAEVPWRQLQLDKVREVPLIHMSSDLGLTTAHPAQSSSPVPGQSTPFARQVRASQTPLLRMRSLSTDSFARGALCLAWAALCRYISARNDIQGEHLERRPGPSNAPNHAQAAALVSWS